MNGARHEDVSDELAWLVVDLGTASDFAVVVVVPGAAFSGDRVPWRVERPV